MSEAIDLSCREFVDVLASKTPAPGGGGASALVGAIGMALGGMVGSLTVGKPEHADVEEDVIALKRRADALADELLALVAADAEAFEPLARAYGLPGKTEEERARKAEVMEKRLHEACEVPLDIMRACCEAIDLHERFAAKGAAIAISDVGCGVVCCKAALKAASLNVFANTRSMRDLDHAARCEREAREMLDAYCAKADGVFADVEKRLA